MVEVVYGLICAVIFEKCLIRSDHFAVFLQACAHPCTQSDNALHAVRGQEGIAKDVPGDLAYTVYASCPLNQADDGPGQIIIHNYRTVLKVLAFAQYIRGNKNA